MDDLRERVAQRLAEKDGHKWSGSFLKLYGDEYRKDAAAVIPMILEAAAKACEAKEKAFSAPEYAFENWTALGGFNERFASRECAAAIRALAKPVK